MDVDLDLSALKIQDKDKKRPYNEVDTGSNYSPNHTEKSSVKPVLRRSGRIKIKSLEPCDNRRVLKKPRKLSSQSSGDNFNVKDYYLDKKIKLHSPALETIFEDPKENQFMSVRKLRRCINFGNLAKERSKVKKRSVKVRELKKVAVIQKKIGMDYLLKQLSFIEDDDK